MKIKTPPEGFFLQKRRRVLDGNVVFKELRWRVKLVTLFIAFFPTRRIQYEEGRRKF